MRIILVRHAIAEDAAAFIAAGGTDDTRPLTEAGRKRMRKAANRLRFQVGAIDVIATSPWTRARETADIIASSCGSPPLVECPALAGDQLSEPILSWLSQYPPTHTIIAVGHEPQLGFLSGLLLTGLARPVVRFRKGGAALLTFEQGIAAGAGQLQWALTPRQLRDLKRDA